MPLMKEFGTKNGFTIAYVFIITSTVLYTLFGSISGLGYFLVFLMRLGLVLAFSLSYFGSSELFDVKVKSRSFAC